MIPNACIGQRPSAARSSLVILAFSAALTGCQPPWGGADGIVGTTECTSWISSYHGTSESRAAWSPAGDEIVAFATHNPRGELAFGPYLVNLRSGAWKQIAQGSGWRYPSAAHWHPHDRTVLVDYGTSADILDIDTGTSRMLSDGSGQRIERARWSPEGDSVWYLRNEGMFVMSTAGGLPRLAFPTSWAYFMPFGGGWSFSPDGRTIAYAHAIREENGLSRNRREIQLIDRDGRNVRQLTRLAGNAQNPLWIHGGREVLFDWADTLCFNRVSSAAERYWFAVDVESGRVRQLRQHLGSPEYQFSFPIGIDLAGKRAAVVGGSKGKRKTDWPRGVLFTTLIELDTRERLLRPGSPEMP